MDFEVIREWLTLENILKLIQEYQSLGPIAGILLPLLEAFLPFLPLFVFVMANATAFGLWWGFFFFSHHSPSLPDFHLKFNVVQQTP